MTKSIIHPREPDEPLLRIRLREEKAYLTHVIHVDWKGNVRWSLEKYTNGKIILWRKIMSSTKPDTVVREEPIMADCNHIKWHFGYQCDPGQDIRDGMRWMDFNSNYEYEDEPILPLIGRL